jgi:small subunit ribosomal protein S9
MPTDLKTKIFAQAIGRRKRSIAQVRLVAGKGEVVINGKKPEAYFGAHQNLNRILNPLQLLKLDKYDVSAKISGGGVNGQLDALVLGIARAVASLKKDNKVAMRDAELLTRDPRKRQRRMVGMGGKSRRKKQSPKR